jgi:hypothetical protein
MQHTIDNQGLLLRNTSDERPKDHRTNASRMDDVAISHLNGDDMWFVVSEPVKMRGHVRGCSRICTPGKTERGCRREGRVVGMLARSG